MKPKSNRCTSTKIYKDLYVPDIYLNNTTLKKVESEKYLGIQMSDNLTDDVDISRHHIYIFSMEFVS